MRIHAITDSTRHTTNRHAKPTSSLEIIRARLEIMQRANQTEIFDETLNPLDSVEDVLNSNDWAFSRMNMDELIVKISGKNCEYRLIFVWQEDMNAIQFCCQYDLSITPENMDTAARTLMSINAKLWMGHFDISHETEIPTFRHTYLTHGTTNSSACFDDIEALIDISLTQCERYHAAFHMLANNDTASSAPILNDQVMSLALMEPLGES